MSDALTQLVHNGLPKHTLATYEARSEAAVRVLAAMCGGDAEREVARLQLVRERLGRRIGNQSLLQTADGRPVNPVLAVAQHILIEMPTIIEMVLTLARGGPRGFAYLTQGSAGATLVDALTALLRGTLLLHLESGGSDERASLMADVFRTLFPNLEGLRDFSAIAQAMLVGVVPRGEGIELKLYFNTRLDTSVPHRDKILQVLALCGLEDHDANARTYDALYQNNERARFTGIGVDLGDDDGRVKMYVHAPRESTIALIDDLIGRGIAQGPTEHARALIEATESDASSTDCEVAFALRGSGPTTLKVTTFFNGKTVSAADGDRALALLSRWGYPTAPVHELFASLDARDSVNQKFPLHGLGVELTADPMPKVNVYVQPNI